jgi:rfaE bifunctional protein kinase chain/domain
VKTLLSRSRLLEILAEIHNLRVGVVGDFALDGYWHVDMTKAQISRETPLFNRPVVAESYSPGGAANVAWNLAALRPRRVVAITVFGDDWRHSVLGGIFDRLGIDRAGILTQPDWYTPFYGKVVLHGLQSHQEDSRVDVINAKPMLLETELRLVARVRELLPDLDALIVGDFIPGGVISERTAAELVEISRANPGKVILADSREHIHQFGGLVIKPNEVEAGYLLHPEAGPGSRTPAQIAAELAEKFAGTARPMYVTAGPEGCWLVQPTLAHIPAVPVQLPIDTVGAGDTFGAALTSALASGAAPVEAACVANLASSVTIRKLGVTGTAAPDEILAAYDAL